MCIVRVLEKAEGGDINDVNSLHVGISEKQFIPNLFNFLLVTETRSK